MTVANRLNHGNQPSIAHGSRSLLYPKLNPFTIPQILSSLSINLNNWQFTAGTTTRALPDVTLQPDSFLILVNSTCVNAFDASMHAVGVTSFPAIVNTGETLILANAQGNVISTISYTDAWYQDNSRKDGGWSWMPCQPVAQRLANGPLNPHPFSGALYGNV